MLLGLVSAKTTVFLGAKFLNRVLDQDTAITAWLGLWTTLLPRVVEASRVADWRASAMRDDVPSRTALEAARHRAAHQLLDGGRLFSDPLALRILGENRADIESDARAHPRRTQLRTFIAARTRFAEDALSSAIECGVRQLVVLGAGLDTFAYRNPYDGLRIFEVDHPATQSWKRECLANASIEPPACLSFAPVDFERESLATGLSAVGFDALSPTFFVWMGVVVYLSKETTLSTLRFIACLKARAHVACDYSNPLAGVGAPEAGDSAALAERMAGIGEPWRNFFHTAQLHDQLRAIGFTAIDDLGPKRIVGRYAPNRIPPVDDNGPHLLHAIKP